MGASDRLGLRPLRILHTENTTAWGGQEIRILSESRGLIDRGHSVVLLAARDSRLAHAAREQRIPVEEIDLRRKGIRQFRTMRDWLARHGRDFDVVNTHGSTDSWMTALARTTLRDMPPIVRTRHVSTTVNRSPATRWLYTKATAHVVTTGETLRRQLHVANGYPLEHMTSVRTGIDLRRFDRMDQRSLRLALNVADGPTLGVLATLRSWKGHAYLLQAFAGLRRHLPLWKLLIIGDGPQRGALEKLVDELDLRGRVRFVGNVEATPEWLATLDLLTLASYGDEGVPQSLMQGMACGLPIVATRVGAVGEAVQDGTTGLLVPPRDPVALAKALSRLMANPSLRARMGQAGWSYARDHFDLDTMLDRMETVFRRTASAKAAAPPPSHGH